MKLWQKLTVAALLLVVGFACASATGRLPIGNTEVVVDNQSFDIVDVEVYCDGYKRFEFRQVTPQSSERRFLQLERCNTINLVVDYFGSYKEPVVSPDIFGISSDHRIVVRAGNSYATTSFMVYLDDEA